MYREGRPVLHLVPPVGDGSLQFIAAWEGAPSGRGTRELRVDLVRTHDDGVRIAWSTAPLFPDGLYARSYAVRSPDIRVRYELHYPGWTPGCDGQTEQEDVFRVAPGRADGDARHPTAAQRVAWRAARAVSGLFAGAGRRRDAGGQRRARPRFRARLSGLRARSRPATPPTARGRGLSIAATGPDRRPWSLTFRRAGARWRLTGASPVLQ